MRTGLSLTDLAKEIERQNKSKRDFLASTGNGVRVLDDGATLELGVNGSAQQFKIGDSAHAQMADRIGIPKKYYDRMKADHPTLLAQNVNAWFVKEPENRMIRTLDGKARAFLSERYRPLDNFDVAQAVLPVLANLNLEVMSSEITESRMYIKAVDKNVHQDVPTGRKIGDGSHVFFDTISPAVIISNSEIGWGALSIESGVYTKICTNMMMIAARGMKKYHVGGKAMDLGDQAYAMLSDKTRRVTDAALWMQVRDVVAAAFNAEKFGTIAEQLAATSENKITGNPLKVIEVTQKSFGWTETESGNVLKHLIEGGDLTQYGLLSAVTRTAEDIADYDRATEFEAMGGQVIELRPDEWRVIAEAA